jgi:UDP-2,3-diacylglucosamine pyrophosphatase LpxH
MRHVFVISDLHVGGAYPATDAPGDRGFRMCTQTEHLRAFVAALADGPACELVINGDFVDFLAEEGDDGWVPFVADPIEAARRFQAVVDRDRPLFDALARFVQRGHRLVLLLGNHDLELSLPAVRRRLQAALGGPFQFVYDGEAYVVGDALVEHGNRYDGFNVVDHDALRRLRSVQSRRLPVTPDLAFTPPVGSRLVAEVMNPIKKDYPFVDLLKPEDEAVAPILLALEPRYKRLLGTLVARKHEAAKHDPIAPARPAYVGEVAADGGGAVATVEDVASAGQVLGLLKLVAAKATAELDARLPDLLRALRGLQADRSTDPAVETKAPYLEAARQLARGGFRYVVFGHTHLAKRVDLGLGATYLNTGTWADLIFFPRDLVEGSDADVLPRLRAFCEDLRDRRFGAWITRKPTYVRLDVGDDGRVAAATLAEYRGGDPRGEGP